jgi:hypothetical protein
MARNPSRLLFEYREPLQLGKIKMAVQKEFDHLLTMPVGTDCPMAMQSSELSFQFKEKTTSATT